MIKKNPLSLCLSLALTGEAIFYGRWPVYNVEKDVLKLCLLALPCKTLLYFLKQFFVYRKRLTIEDALNHPWIEVLVNILYLG